MTEIFLVTGKGGVGKSTTSAATALHQAEAGKRVLLMSSDPAHNLGDLFQVALSNEAKEVTKNLWAMEMDATARALKFMNTINTQFRAIFKKSAGIEVDLFNDMVMPGMDEIFFCRTILDEYESDKWDVIIADTPPSGQALRALTTPEILDAWLGRILALKKKLEVFKGAFFKRSEQIDEEATITAMRNDISQFRKIMGASTSHILLVTLPERLSIMETHRTLEFLEKINLKVWGVIVNRIVPDFGDEWESELASVQLLHSQHRVHAESLTLAGQVLGEMNVRQVPMVAYEPVGLPNLRKFSKLIWG
jgi:arsenite-transporting ATPase